MWPDLKGAVTSGLLTSMLLLPCLAQDRIGTEESQETQASAEEKHHEPGAGEREPGPAIDANEDGSSSNRIADTATGSGLKSGEREFGLNLLADQKAFWTGPARFRLADAHWLVLAGIMTGTLIASDTSIGKALPHAASLIRQSQDFSTYGLASLTAVAGTFYLWGNVTNNAHERETGLLSGEALADVLIDTSLLQFATGRDRPLAGNGKGDFWQGGRSFPSTHTAAAWSVASVMAQEYPGPLTKLLVYGTASAISASRVLGRQHFASDAAIGSALGWFSGRQVYRAHHDPELDGAAWGTFQRSREPAKPAEMGSPYVPLDSWIYAAFDRLIALGYVQSGIVGMRPWTRMECARLVAEAGQLMEQQDGYGGEGGRLYRDLAREFSSEAGLLDGGRNFAAGVESIYTRVTGITGTPLTDGYHFGQTIVNDYGRPYAEGFNMVTGVSSHAELGPLAFYVRGEYQHAPVTPPFSQDVRNAIMVNDNIPYVPGPPTNDINRWRLLDSYAAFGFQGFQISAGRQSLWWGPGRSGPLLFSDNAEPIDMLRINRVSPIRLPSILSWMGPTRTEFFFGRLQGHHFPPHPFIHGQKISFKPTPNLEFGFSRTVVFAGPPQPLTWGTFFQSFFATSSGNPDPRKKPGDKRGGFDFSYRVPGLRKWLILYSDSLVDDDPSPLAAPRHAAMSPGIYLPRLPGLPKLDFRAEAVYTDIPSSRSIGGRYIYYEGIYRDSYTNDGYLLGNWIGREGKGIQAWSTYWLSSQSTLQVGYRNAHVAHDFLQGGTLEDFSARADLRVRPQLSLSSSLQYERWIFPLLSPARNTNVTASVQLTFWPAWSKR